MRITETFARLNHEKRKALIPYITAGHPHPSLTVPIMQKLVDAGADMIELGVPFSEPIADGVVIAAAHECALQHKVSLARVLQMAAEFRREDTKTPIILMTYANPVEVMGYEFFATTCHQTGIDGVLVVDMPLEEGKALFEQLKSVNIAPIFLITPTTSDARLKSICEQALGYLYYVSLKGITGSLALNVANVQENVTKLRNFTSLPIAIGFGIRDEKTAASLSKTADGIIVGTALVERITQNQHHPDKLLEAIGELMRQLREGMEA